MTPGPWVATVVGIALMAVPAVLGYADTPAADVHRVIGPLAATFGIISLWEATRGVRWAVLPLAAGLVVAPVLVSHPPAAIAAGIVSALALAASTPPEGPAKARLGGGWSALVHPTGSDGGGPGSRAR